MKKPELKNKNILYIGPVFFSYDQILIKKLRDLGCHVDTFELYVTGLRFKLINKFEKHKVDKFKENYYNKALKGRDYDFVLVREGQQLSGSFLKNLKEINPKARFINFHWDSLKEIYNYEPIIKYFDKVYSFDYKDSQNNNQIQYLPLFCRDEYLNSKGNSSSAKFDLLFIGAWRNEERVDLINMTESACKEKNLKFHHHLYSPLWEQLWLIRTGRKPRYAKSKFLTHNNILKLFSITNTIIDFPSSFQTGLTIRTFETLGAGKKLITTNKNIINEPFYDPEYVSIIDVNNIKLDTEFIKRVPTSTIQDKMKNYSIENYIYKLLQD